MLHILATVLGMIFVSYKLLRSKPRHENLPPGPPGIPIIGHFHLLRQPINISIDKLLKKYGPILFLRLGFRPVLVLSSPTAIKECFTKRDVIFANPPRLLIGELADKYSTIPMAEYGDVWRNLRRLTTVEIFSTFRLDLSSKIREEEARVVIRGMFKGSDGVFKKVELKPVLCKLIFNFLAVILGMKPFFAEEEVVDSAKGKHKLDELRSAFTPTQIFVLGDFIPFLKWISRWRVDKMKLQLIEKRDKFLQEIINDFRRKGSSSGANIKDIEEKKEKKRTVIDVLLSLQQTEPEYYTDDLIKGIILVIFTAGSVTSATTMEWAMSLLLNHPEVLNKAREEIELNVGFNRLLNESDLIKLPYLRNIITETLRVCTPGHYLPPYESLEDCAIGGYNIPKGTMLLVNQSGLHNDPKEWSEPTAFKPERFEMPNGTTEGINWIAFGQGRRSCPGEGLAMRMLGLSLGLLIQCFDWERVGGESVDMSSGDQRFRAKATPLEAMCRPRNSVLHVLSRL